MDPVRASHARSVEEGERLIAPLFATLAKNVAAIVEDVGDDGPLNMTHHAPIMSRVDCELARIYPQARGDSCVLEQRIVLACNRARIRSLKANFGPILKRIRQADPSFLSDLHG